jgi:hypothetical protein
VVVGELELGLGLDKVGLEFGLRTLLGSTAETGDGDARGEVWAGGRRESRTGVEAEGGKVEADIRIVEAEFGDVGLEELELEPEFDELGEFRFEEVEIEVGVGTGDGDVAGGVDESEAMAGRGGFRVEFDMKLDLELGLELVGISTFGGRDMAVSEVTSKIGDIVGDGVGVEDVTEVEIWIIG